MKFRTLAIAALLTSVSGIPFAYATEADPPTTAAAQPVAAQPAAAAQPATAPPNPFSATLTMVSDYAWRGISQNDQHPAVQGSFDYANANGIYVGVWGSNVDFNNGGDTTNVTTEGDIYAGYKFPVPGGVNMDIGGQQVIYPGSHQSIDHYDYFEGHVAGSKDLGFANLTLQGNYSPEFFGESGHEENLNLSDVSPIASTGVSFTANVEHTWIQNTMAFGTPDWTDWSAGLGYTLAGFNLAATFVDTSLTRTECGGGGCGPRGIASVSRTF